MKKSELQEIIREEISKKLNEDTKVSNLANGFIQDVLKMGSRENLFDAYLKKNKVKDDLLNELIIEVIEILKKYT